MSKSSTRQSVIIGTSTFTLLNVTLKKTNYDWLLYISVRWPLGRPWPMKAAMESISLKVWLQEPNNKCVQLPNACHASDHTCEIATHHFVMAVEELAVLEPRGLRHGPVSGRRSCWSTRETMFVLLTSMKCLRIQCVYVCVCVCVPGCLYRLDLL